ncbi:MAG: DNA adenine methylase [Anaerolineales bacterium]|nr:DNA adenine methylase [Anaerolineales bacterium]
MPFFSPLRYPGGKRRLVNFMKTIIQQNGLLHGAYIEPFAGGASVGLALLFDGYVNHIYINDLDRSVYAFWYSVLHKTEELAKLIQETPVTMSEWYKQRDIQKNKKYETLVRLGFSTFFLNRTNRSGIISGGVIGGKEQNGDWKLDCRFNKTELVGRIRKIAENKRKISLYNKDASTFIQTELPQIEHNSLVYLDPPYYVKGQQMLYVNYYEPDDHKSIANSISQITQQWVISYDDVPEIRLLYRKYESLAYKLHYTVQDKYKGNEILFFCDRLVIPQSEHPQKIKAPKLASQPVR